MKTTTKQVPADAMRFFTGPCQLHAEADGKIPFSMLARTGEPIAHHYFGQLVHDMAGLVHKTRVPIDYCHNTDQLLGYADEFNVDDEGLHVAGYLTPVGEDRAAEIVAKAALGVPYEASIAWDSASAILEALVDGDTARVNGRLVQGPATIVRKWRLIGVAIVPHGYDPGTKTELTASVQYLASPWRRSEPEPSTSPKTGQEYLTAFGPDGGVWFAEGLSWVEAGRRSRAKLAGALETRQERIADLEARLKAVATYAADE